MEMKHTAVCVCVWSVLSIRKKKEGMFYSYQSNEKWVE